MKCFSGTTIDYVYLNLIPMLRKKQLLQYYMWIPTILQIKHLVFAIKCQTLTPLSKKINCHVILSSTIDRLDGKAVLTTKRLDGLLLESSL